MDHLLEEALEELGTVGVEEVGQALASFCHVDTGKNLDQRF